MVVDLIGQSHFHFVRIFVMDFTIGLGGAESLAIGEAILTETDIAIGFFELSLW